MLLNSKAVHGLSRPSNQDHRSVLNWFAAKKPLVKREEEYIRRKEDLVSIHCGRECGGFDVFVEKCLSLLDGILMKCNCNVVKAGSGPQMVFRRPTDMKSRGSFSHQSSKGKRTIHDFFTTRRHESACW